MPHRGHGEGSIYRRKDGRWVAGITLENRKRKYFYGETRKEVQEKLKIALHEQQQGALATGPQQTVKQYLEQWLKQVHKPAIRKGSYVTYSSVLNKHVYPAIGHIQLQKLTPQQVQAFYASMIDEGLSTKTVHLIHAVLHKSLDHAIKWGLITRNVCSSVSLPRKARYEIQPLTSEQCQKLLQVAQGHRFENLLTLAVNAQVGGK
jgi:integrase